MIFDIYDHLAAAAAAPATAAARHGVDTHLDEVGHRAALFLAVSLSWTVHYRVVRLVWSSAPIQSLPENFPQNFPENFPESFPETQIQYWGKWAFYYAREISDSISSRKFSRKFSPIILFPYMYKLLAGQVCMLVGDCG